MRFKGDKVDSIKVGEVMGPGPDGFYRQVTDVWFAIYGANLNLDADGNVELVIDAQLVLDFYLGLCAAQGVTDPPVIGR